MVTTISADSVRPPSWRFLASHPAHAIAFAGGAGLSPFAPGTVGTLVAIPLHLCAVALLHPYAYLALIAALFVLGVWASERTSHALGVSDHGGIVCDEVVAFLLVLYCTPAGYAWMALAFALFRLFDIVKPPPIRTLEHRLPGGFGVMADDLLAAGYTIACLQLVRILLL